jgi:hypothetical protein
MSGSKTVQLLAAKHVTQKCYTMGMQHNKRKLEASDPYSVVKLVALELSRWSLGVCILPPVGMAAIYT